MSNMGAILILEQGREQMVIPGTDMYKLLLGKDARVSDSMKTPSGHLALKVEEDGAATEDKKVDAVYYYGQPSLRGRHSARQRGS
eukprot:8770892-Pyramimonas_sp.AAC.1